MATRFKFDPDDLESKAYCRKCMRYREKKFFYKAVDKILDTSGLMSVCVDCIDDLFTEYVEEEKNLQKAVLRTCRVINLAYNEKAIESTKSQVDNEKLRKETAHVKFFGVYRIQLVAKAFSDVPTSGRATISQDVEFTFREPMIMPSYVNERVDEEGEPEMIVDQEYYEENWGKSLSSEDYEFLEKEFTKWKKTTKCDTQSEEILVREICYKQNEIRKARILGKSTDSLVKGLQEIMKNSALTPAMQSAANSGKAADCFGSWLKEIETTTPAEWYADKQKYHDMDGIGLDIADIKRSIGNFITGSRDFNTEDLIEINEEDDGKEFLPESG